VNFCDLDPPRLCRCSFQLALVLGVAACGATTVAQGPQAPGVAEMQGRQEPASFRFYAPPGTKFVWTERREFDAALVGTDVADHDVSELRWDVSMHSSSSEPIVIDQRLVRVSYEHAGQTVVSGAPENALIQLAVDSEGTLESVSGVEAVSRAVHALASPEAAPLVDRMFSGAALAALVRARTQLMLEDVVGRPTHQGATWIVPQLPASDALFKRYSVEGAQPCDASPGGEPTACTQLHVWVDVRPRAAETLARSLIERYAQGHGQQVAALPQWSGAYHLWGMMRVQPATLLPASAALREAGHLAMMSDGKRYDVDLRATTDDTYEYGPQNVAVAP
jgi:hypothetical protein